LGQWLAPLLIGWAQILGYHVLLLRRDNQTRGIYGWRNQPMAKKRVFTSFDFDHDEDLRNLLVGQSKNPDSPFEMADWSVKEAESGDWEEKVRARIRRCQLIVVLCGEHTDSASGVGAELRIAQDEGIPYFLLWGRSSKTCKKPMSAKSTDRIYNWTWDNLKQLIGGSR